MPGVDVGGRDWGCRVRVRTTARRNLLEGLLSLLAECLSGGVINSPPFQVRIGGDAV